MYGLITLYAKVVGRLLLSTVMTLCAVSTLVLWHTGQK